MSIEDLHEQLKEKRKEATSHLTWKEFHAAVIEYEPGLDDPGRGHYWRINMKTYYADDGRAPFSSQYNIATRSDPSLTIDDFRVHYNALVHWMWFHRRTHSQYTVVSIERETQFAEILVFKAFGERFDQCNSLLEDVLAMHKNDKASRK